MSNYPSTGAETQLEQLARALSMPIEDVREIAERYRRAAEADAAHEKLHCDHLRRIKRRFIRSSCL